MAVNSALSKLAEAEGAVTARELGVSYDALPNLVSQGLAREGKTVKTGKRGRPARSFQITAKGRKAAAKQTEAAAA